LQAQKALKPRAVALGVHPELRKAGELADLIRGGDGGKLISDRGSVAVDNRTNTLLVQDVPRSLENIRRLVTTLDIPVRQVQIETRVVIVNDDYSRELGVRFGTTLANGQSDGGLISLAGNSVGSDTIVGSALNNIQTTGQPVPRSRCRRSTAVQRGPAGSAIRRGSFALASWTRSYLVDLELSALQARKVRADRVTARVVATNQREARIEQGVPIRIRNRRRAARPPHAVQGCRAAVSR
jgi:type IV pilus assembly protein PilQ